MTSPWNAATAEQAEATVAAEDAAAKQAENDDRARARETVIAQLTAFAPNVTREILEPVADWHMKTVETVTALARYEIADLIMNVRNPVPKITPAAIAARMLGVI
jgi:hypothetical protein